MTMIKRFSLALLSSLMLTACIGAGVNTDITPNNQNVFPSMTGIDLFGETRDVPSTFSGEINMIAVAFQQEQQEDVNTWITLADEIIAQDENFRFYEIPVIFKANPIFRTWVNNGMRSGIPSDEARERTITVYTDREQFINLMDMQMDRIYVLLTDQKGRILLRSEGPLTEEKEQNIRTFLESRAG